MTTEATAETYQDEHDTGVTEAWSISDLATADWALGRIADLEREIAENAKVAEQAIARIRAREQVLSARAQRGVAFFKGKLSMYAEAHRAELLGGGKKKSRALMHGTIGWRSKGGGLEVTDKAALLEWARLQPVELGLVRITEAPALDEVKRAFKLTGEVPPGCDVSEEREEVVIKAEMGEVTHEQH